ncbi:MAG: hypothetical protein U1E65_03330 [Myxococcota bacterium]
MKLAVIITSDPKAGEEALGRTFNGLALVAEAQKKGDQVELVFAGTGTRWPAELAQLGHPAHGLYQSVRGAVCGASCACATVFGAAEGLRAAGVPELKQNELSGTPGLASIRRYLDEGFQTMVF